LRICAGESDSLSSRHFKILHYAHRPAFTAQPLGRHRAACAEAIGIPGLYVTDDPGAKNDAARTGTLGLRFGLGWAKSHSFLTGQTPVMK
jgi:hypothetical protein